LLLAIPTLLAVFTIIFLIVRVAPGDPATAALGDAASEEAVAALRERMGLNEPLWKQYLTFLSDLVQGDLGRSLITQQPARSQISFVLPYTLELTICAILIGLALGVPIGTLTAVRRNQPTDYVGRVVSLIGLSLPAFYLAILMMYLLSVRLKWLPAVGDPGFEDPVRNLKYLIMPALTLGLIETAYIARMTRSVMIGILSDDYVRTARAKGLAEKAVIFRHALRNALVPILTVVGLTFAALMGGAVVTETVFSIPGIGQLVVQSVLRRDYPVIQGVTLIVAVSYVFINLLVDVLYLVVDPRVKY
jgi:ABC-type dipeptide/oligopeptide/nickel transport system permease component